jgi:TolB-like protein
MKLFSELKRRNVLRVALAYLAIAWLVVQIVETMFPILGLPDELILWAVILLSIGFPIVVGVAWFFELTPQGMMTTAAADAAGYAAGAPNRRYVDFIIIALLVVAVAWLIYERQSGPGFPEKSVAILPLHDLSPGGGQEWFADGLTEEILNSLARLRELKVPARTSAFHFKGQRVPIQEIALALGVKYVVEGSVRRDGERLLVTAQMSRAEDGYQVWSDKYDRSTQDALDVQHEIAESIARALNVVVDDEKREAMYALGTSDVDAYDHFLRGRQFMYEWLNDNQDEKMWEATLFLDRAIAADEDFAAAYALRVQPFFQFLDGLLPSPVAPTEDLPSYDEQWASTQLQRYASVASGLAEDTELGLVMEIVEVLNSDDFSTLPQLAERVNPPELAVASDAVPLYHVSLALAFLGISDKDLHLAQERIERDPLSPLGYVEAWRALQVSGKTEEGIRYLKLGQGSPGKSMFLEHALLMSHLTEGNFNEAIHMAEDQAWGMSERRESLLALVYAAAGRNDDAHEVIVGLSETGVENEFLALAMYQLGDNESAKRIFETADERAGFAQIFAATITEFGGRVPWNLAWTPNFAARLHEAGVVPESFEFPDPK